MLLQTMSTSLPFPGKRRFFLLVCLWVSAVLLPADSGASDTNLAWLEEHYTKYEHLIPMRDGVRLFTRVYMPKDDSQPWPIVLTRTPYGLKPYGEDNYGEPSG